MNQYNLYAIGHVVRQDKNLILHIEEKIIPAMKNLSLFSHATLIFGDGTGALHLRVTKLSEVNEKSGRIILDESCRLMDGNVIYDIKPYIPCEDRIVESQTPENTEPEQAPVPGGQDEITLSGAGFIRKEKGRYFLYPDDYGSISAIAGKCSHIKVLWWFSRFDKKEYRRATQGEPPYENAPRSGVFASRSPVRPNPIALTVANILDFDSRQKRIEVSGLDCFDNTPLIGIRPYRSQTDKIDNYSVPQWLEHWPDYKKMEPAASAGDLVLHDWGEEFLDHLLGRETPGTDTISPVTAEADDQQQQRDVITIRGARQNNLKDLTLTLPKDKVIAIAGVSGSGKSSLAFDTLYAESRLRLSETADGVEKPDIDSITGLPPAVAVAQHSIGRNPRSTVGTFTGIQDRLRLLYAAIGRRHCPECGNALRHRSSDELAELVNRLSDHKLTIIPHGTPEPLTPINSWDETVHDALRIGKGAFWLHIDGGKGILLQSRQMCFHCETILFEMSPALFSFNNPESMCPVCSGLGKTTDIDPALVVTRPDLSLLDGASDYWGDLRTFIKNPTANWMRGELLALAESCSIDLETPWNKLPEEFRQTALYGNNGKEVSWSYTHPKNGRSGTITRPVEGAIPILNRLLKKGGSAAERISAQYVRPMPCPSCQGERLAREGRMVTVDGVRYPQAAAMDIDQLLDWIRSLPEKISAHDLNTGRSLLKEIINKAAQLKEVGLSYLRLDRVIPTLSGGELQRLKLVTQMGIGLSGLLYVMDEPTAGLHPKDYPSILNALRGLRDDGNTVLVAEHEETILRAADWLVEIGPGAGQYGGQVIWQGSPQQLTDVQTQTSRFLSGQEHIVIDRPALPPQDNWVRISGANGNNLKNIDVTFPKGRITCITGVSGSGKSTLAGKVIAPAVERLIGGQSTPDCCREIHGAEDIIGVIHASQSSIGRNRRSNVATFMGLLDDIRPVFAATEQAKMTHLTASAFSFNSREGQCDTCKGEGVQTIPVPFSADIHVTCPVCMGKRYKKNVLDIQFRGKSIFDVLEMSAEEAYTFFHDQEKIVPVLQVLCGIGLGYLRLGQGAGTLSGGESQRLKLAKALCEKQSARMLYILDEPTSGLHFSDIQNLLSLLSRLAADGHTVLIIEHNRHVIRNADWIIDLGPEAGEAGGQVLVQGTPETVMVCAESHTGKWLNN